MPVHISRVGNCHCMHLYIFLGMQQNKKEEKTSSAQICDQMCAILLLHAKSSNSPGQLLEVTIVPQPQGRFKKLREEVSHQQEVLSMKRALAK